MPVEQPVIRTIRGAMLLWSKTYDADRPRCEIACRRMIGRWQVVDSYFRWLTRSLLTQLTRSSHDQWREHGERIALHFCIHYTINRGNRTARDLDCIKSVLANVFRGILHIPRCADYWCMCMRACAWRVYVLGGARLFFWCLQFCRESNFVGEPMLVFTNKYE